MAKKVVKNDQPITLEDLQKCIKSFKEKHGYVPTKSDIARALETTKQNIHQHFVKNQAVLEKIPDYKRYFAVKT